MTTQSAQYELKATRKARELMEHVQHWTNHTRFVIRKYADFFAEIEREKVYENVERQSPDYVPAASSGGTLRDAHVCGGNQQREEHLGLRNEGTSGDTEPQEEA